MLLTMQSPLKSTHCCNIYYQPEHIIWD